MAYYNPPVKKKHIVTSVYMECSIAEYYGYRENIVLPNLHWALSSKYEKDMVIIRPSGFAFEVEIKISKADLRADLKKGHGHFCNMMRQLWFAIPDYMNTEECLALIPERAGVVVVDTSVAFATSGRCTTVRRAKINRSARRLEYSEILKTAHLSAMRIWGLKKTILDGSLQKQKGWKPV
jgi:hypothetical protein